MGVELRRKDRQVRRSGSEWSVGRRCRYVGAAVDGRWGEGAGTQERQRVIGGARVQVRRSVWIHRGQHCHNSKPRPGRYAEAAGDGRWGEGAGT